MASYFQIQIPFCCLGDAGQIFSVGLLSSSRLEALNYLTRVSAVVPDEALTGSSSLPAVDLRIGADSEQARDLWGVAERCLAVTAAARWLGAQQNYVQHPANC